tara:strand:+ start:1493 stop:2569 length:1077 start_codon:yes stop_codon:yes gene_type:complete
MNREKLLNYLRALEIDDVNFLKLNSLQSFQVDGDIMNLTIGTTNPSLQYKNTIRKKIKEAVLLENPSCELSINFVLENKSNSVDSSSIKNIIAVASGKGGVGKSTISSNLALGLKKQGFSVGLIDADIYGPSIPLMFDAEFERPKAIKKNNQELMSPVISYGVKIMSIGFFSDPNKAIIWRGPMATKALKQIIDYSDWGQLDYLIVDLPPGTSDIHLSLVQSLSLTGAVIVTTPQPVSLIDAKKAMSMFSNKDINVPIIGLVENMSWLLLQNKKHYIFGKDGGKLLSESEGVELLAQIPLDQTIREACDVGRPAILQESVVQKTLDNLAAQVHVCVNQRNSAMPKTKKVEITHNRGCN